MTEGVHGCDKRIMAETKIDDQTPVRLDRWLWAARFFKTRSMAGKAVMGGHVHVNGVRAKPSRSVTVGDEIRITINSSEWLVIVLGLSDRRGPAAHARLLYQETEASRQAREDARLMRSLAVVSARPTGKPSKKDRRALRVLLGK